MASQVTSAPAKTNRYESYVDDQLEKTRARIKIVDLCTGIFALVGWVLGVLLFFTVVDSWIWTLGTFGRILALVVLLGGIAAISIFYIAPLFLRKINPKYAAQMIEQARPKFKNSILNYLWTKSSNRKVSHSVANELSQQAATDISEVTANESVDQSNLIRIGFIVVGLAILVVAYSMLSPKSPIPTLTRVLSPFSEISRPAIVRVLSVTPGNTEVFFGDVLPITAEIRGSHEPEDVQLIYSTDDGQHTNVPMQMKATGPYRYEIDLKTSGTGIQQNLKYKIKARDGESPWYSVNVKPLPAVLIKSLKLVPPKYTNLAERVVNGTGEVDGVEGTRVYIEAIANLPVQNAYVEFLKPDRNDPDNLVVSKTSDLDFENQDLSGSFLLTLNSERDGPFCTHYQIRYQSTDGDLNSKPNVYPVRVTPDFAPELDILEPKSTEVLLPVNGTLNIQVEATDVDYEITGLGLQLTNQGIRILNHEFEVPQNDRQRVRQTYWLVPEKLSLEPGDKVSFFATAADNRHSPYGDLLDPNVTRSENYSITIIEADSRINKEKRDEEIEQAEKEQKQNNQNDAAEDEEQNGKGSSEQEQDGSEGDEQNPNDSTTNDENEQDATDDESDSDGSQDSTDPDKNDENDQESDGSNSAGGSSDSSSNPQESSDNSSDQDNESSQNGGAENDSTQENETSQGNGSNNQKSNGNNGNSSQQGTGQSQSETNDEGSRENSQSTEGNPQQGNPENANACDNNTGQQDDAQDGDGQRDNNLQDGSVRDDALEGHRIEELMEYVNEKNKQNQSNPGDQTGDDKNPSESNDSGDNKQRQEGDFDPNQFDTASNGENSTNQESGNREPTDQDTGDQGAGNQGAGNQEAGNQEAGNQEAGNQEAGNQEAGNQDGGNQDGGNQDAGNQDGGNQDSGNQDSGNQDSGNQDSGNQDSGNQDSGNQDAGNQDAGNQDAGNQDAGNQDAGNQDAGNQDAGNQDGGNQGNPSTDSSNTESNEGDSSTPSENPAQTPTSQSSGTNSGSGAEDYGQSATGDLTGTGNRDNNPNARAQTDREFEQAKREKENIKRAKHATGLVLDELRKQADDPDPELLKRMNWTPQELRDFLESWEKMKNAAAAGGAREKRLYESRLKSLGLQSTDANARRLEGDRDEMFGLSEEGAVNRPPADWSERYNRFQRLRNRVDRE